MRRYDESDVIEKLSKIRLHLSLLSSIKSTNPHEELVKEKIEYWIETLNPNAIFAVSALNEHNVTGVMQFILDKFPEHPALL